MSFYVDLTAIRTTEVERVIEYVESELTPHGLLPMSGFSDSPISAIVFEPHSGWVVVSAGVGYGYALADDLSKDLGTDAVAVMVADVNGAGCRVFTHGFERASFDVDVSELSYNDADPTEYFGTFRDLAADSISDQQIRAALDQWEMPDAESVGSLLALLGLPEAFGSGAPEDFENSVAYGLPEVASAARVYL
ncbi:MAG: hypothetical protein KDA93_04220, partial [Planctomycetaceae bacterium]|nr:hypothetical protein [Planctomycetaceae bacterium]